MTEPSRTIRHTAKRIEVDGLLYGAVRISLNERSPLTADEARALTEETARMWSRILERRVEDG